MTKEARNTKPERRKHLPHFFQNSGFEILSSFGIRHSSLPLFLSLGRCNKEPLIRKRRQHRNDRHPEKRADAVELFDLSEIVEEQFEQRNAQQSERGVTGPRLFL